MIMRIMLIMSIMIMVIILIVLIKNKYIMVIMHIMLIILRIQVRIDLGLADHVWQNKRIVFTAIAQEVDGLGAQFCPAMCDGWLKYIKDTYAARQAGNRPIHWTGEDGCGRLRMICCFCSSSLRMMTCCFFAASGNHGGRFPQ
jgi:hypothetical protein